MATSAARIRSLYRRHHQAHEAVYHFSACSPAGAAVNLLSAKIPRHGPKHVCRRTLPRCPPSGDGTGRSRLAFSILRHFSISTKGD